MPETPSHRRAKNKAAGPGGQTEVPLPGGKRLDARTQGGGRAAEVERSGSAQGLAAAARRLFLPLHGLVLTVRNNDQSLW